MSTSAGVDCVSPGIIFWNENLSWRWHLKISPLLLWSVSDFFQSRLQIRWPFTNFQLKGLGLHQTGCVPDTTPSPVPPEITSTCTHLCSWRTLVMSCGIRATMCLPVINNNKYSNSGCCHSALRHHHDASHHPFMGQLITNWHFWFVDAPVSLHYIDVYSYEKEWDMAHQSK